MNIGPYSIEDYMHMIKSFHGHVAPGLIIGGFMVDLAKKNLPDDIFFDAISETSTCLPDAIQLLTPCTIGNGWLKIMDFGRYALSLYEKYTGEGVRVFMDSSKVRDWPEVRDWFFKLKTKKEQDPNRLRDEIIDAGPDMLSIQQIVVDTSFLGKKGKGAIAECPACHEAYPGKDGSLCLACQGNSPYKIDKTTLKPNLVAIPGGKGQYKK
jgi:formylmethanofuran dehydrogenase subunit E